MVPSRVAWLMSYSLMWPSSEPVSSLVLSGLKLSERMGMACPSSVCTSLRLVSSNTLMMPSMAPVARYFPSLEAARLRVNLLLLSRLYSSLP